MTHTEKIFHAFEDRHIRLRLHGTRLPPNYTIYLRVNKSNNATTQPRRPKRKRRRKERGLQPRLVSSSDSDMDIKSDVKDEDDDDNLAAAALASDGEAAADQDEQIRRNNAYPGATNTIGSIHQRQWFLSLDRVSSGFVREAGRWVRKTSDDGMLEGFETFFVRGRDVERSVVTGRLAEDVMADEGVKGYMGRKMWRPITE